MLQDDDRENRTVNALQISFIVFAFIAGGGLLGIFLRNTLPQHHLSQDAKDVARLGTGLIGTIAALVLGLLIASAKSSYDTRSGQINQLTANVILLDNALAKYGAEANPARESLRRTVTIMTERIWSESLLHQSTAIAYTTNEAFTELVEQLDKLAADSESRRSAKDRASQAAGDLAKIRFLLFAEAETDQSIPVPFLMVLVFWLTIIFISFSLFAQPNPIVIGCLFLFAVSAAAAIYLVLELAQPFDGLMQISNAPLQNALGPIAR
jgi:hypothetical protein